MFYVFDLSLLRFSTVYFFANGYFGIDLFPRTRWERYPARVIVIQGKFSESHRAENTLNSHEGRRTHVAENILKYAVS